LNTHRLHYQRANAALQNLFVADALAMPVHWYYSLRDIEKAFPGGVKQLEPAPQFHPSSIMSLHSTSSGGRRAGNAGSRQPEVVGEVILKGRQQYWNKPNTHYHQGMSAGENTLNAHCARVLMRCLARTGGQYDPAAFLSDYIDFMCADVAQHYDTYAESYHRGFFANLQRGLPPERCAALTHDTPSIGGLVTVAPLVLAGRIRDIALDTLRADVQTHVQLTHPDALLLRIADDYTQLLNTLLHTTDNSDVAGIIADTALRSMRLDLPGLMLKKRDDREVIGQLYSSACYIDGAWPGILYLLYKYHDQPEAALIANTNLGGDNVHRGAVLGVLLGLIHGHTIVPWYNALTAKQQIDQEIAQLLN
jgi:ADP-ribosylglycohydrolase